MRSSRRVLVRWLPSLLLAAVAGWVVSASAASIVRSRDGWGTILFLSVFGLALATPFALAAYFCFKRRYRHLFMVGAAVAAWVLLGIGFTVPNKLGLFDAARNWKRGEPWQPLLMVALSVLLLLGPFYCAGAFLRLCSHFAARRFPDGRAPDKS